jgi:hypothetical protein
LCLAHFYSYDIIIFKPFFAVIYLSLIPWFLSDHLLLRFVPVVQCILYKHIDYSLLEYASIVSVREKNMWGFHFLTFLHEMSAFVISMCQRKVAG